MMTKTLKKKRRMRMKSKSNLNEGLVLGDLDDLVLPLLSVDEYESKISDDNIVVAFYVKDNEPAKDLARFISKSEIDILDAEVSPVPNEEGNFLVFVEFVRDNTFVEDLISLIESLSGLTSNDKWSLKAYKRKSMELSKDNLEKNVRLKPKSKTKQLENMLTDTKNVRLFEGELVAGTEYFKVLAIGSNKKLFEAYELDNKAILMDSDAVQLQNLLSRAFGASWAVEVFESSIAVTNIYQNLTVLLKKL